jgi:hypothetical protein
LKAKKSEELGINYFIHDALNIDDRHIPPFGFIDFIFAGTIVQNDNATARNTTVVDEVI